jgi:zinc/manganese transport system substrate-binding protein
VRPGQPGYFEAAAFVTLLGKPTRLDRADGDVHAAGDPHIQTDPRNILRVAQPLAARLAELDPPMRRSMPSGKRHSRTSSARRSPPGRGSDSLRGVPIVVQHKGFTYLIAWLGMQEVAALEPKPGVEPTTSYLGTVLETLQARPPKMVLRAAYQSDRASQWIAERAKINAVVLPFTVGGDEQAKDLYSLFDDTIARCARGRNDPWRRRGFDPAAGVHRRHARVRDARAARHAGARARDRVHRSRDRADRRLRRAARGPARLRAEGIAVQVAALRRRLAARCC